MCLEHMWLLAVNWLIVVSVVGLFSAVTLHCDGLFRANRVIGGVADGHAVLVGGEPQNLLNGVDAEYAASGCLSVFTQQLTVRQLTHGFAARCGAYLLTVAQPGIAHTAGDEYAVGAFHAGGCFGKALVPEREVGVKAGVSEQRVALFEGFAALLFVAFGAGGGTYVSGEDAV